jgi:WD40 repeat protein
MIVTASDRSGDVRIKSISSGCCECILQGHSGGVKDICWSAAGKHVMPLSVDSTVHIWNVRRKKCSKIYAAHPLPLTLACSADSILVAFIDGTVQVYDSRSHDMLHTISASNTGRLTHSRFSIDGDKILLAYSKTGSIQDLTSKMRVWSIDYERDGVFSPDGTCVASIYGKFLKIWKSTAGYEHNRPPIHLGDSTLDDICFTR